jgi:hypothetical protein
MENYAPAGTAAAGLTPTAARLWSLFRAGLPYRLCKAKEFCLFCWGSLYKNRVVTPLGLQLELIDEMLSKAGSCTGVPCYLPPMAQGEDISRTF